MSESTLHDTIQTIRDADVPVSDADAEAAAEIYDQLEDTITDPDQLKLPDQPETYAAVVFAAVRATGSPIAAREIADVVDVDTGRLFRLADRVVDRVAIDVQLRDAHAFIDRFGDALDAEDHVTARAHALYDNAPDAVNGRAPQVAAAAALYAAIDELSAPIKQGDVVDAADVSSPPVSALYTDIQAEAGVTSEDKREQRRESIRDLMERIHDDVGADSGLDRAEDLLEEHGVEWSEEIDVRTAAAVLYYYAARDDGAVSQATVADAVGINPTVIGRHRDRVPFDVDAVTAEA
ncbi:transcription factor TFIIB cyclin-related protein [Halosimplex carlsbadense 2-9-1]|uniref:Transcription factor TFIIB cyclin-related protein n=1 Tax=Halosimplex carlsbadense 2-9-1 TaxID=797114 RepID=M0CXD7_9EURY|nr:transcription factor TFIIB cyclin-related protein [Halosimplex carlsbadense]ELZ26529.1 transcription factor TFIIB cyclin-related protein [Halosimplex carlsbadense 2-9-1]